MFGEEDIREISISVRGKEFQTDILPKKSSSQDLNKTWIISVT